jgi:hypothetical protein
MAKISGVDLEAILRMIVMLKPVVEWCVVQIEKLFRGIKTGEEKKEIAMAELAPLIPDKELRSVAIDSVVWVKNMTGEFAHS